MPAVTVRQKIPRDAQSSQPELSATFVLLHGWGFDSRIWQPLQTLLSQWAEVWLLDMDCNSQTAESLCDAIVDVLPDESLLVGWSLGGMLASKLVAQSSAAKKNKSISGLVVLSANVKFVANDAWPVAMPQKTFTAFLEGAEKNIIKQRKRFNMLVSQGDGDSREQLMWLQNEMAMELPDKKSLLDGLSILNAIDNTQVFNQINIPSLFLWGENDMLVPSSIVDHLLVNQDCHEYHTLINKGHCLHYPEGECQMLIQRFLGKFASD